MKNKNTISLIYMQFNYEAFFKMRKLNNLHSKKANIN